MSNLLINSIYMSIKNKPSHLIMAFFVMLMLFYACKSGTDRKTGTDKKDTTQISQNKTDLSQIKDSSVNTKQDDIANPAKKDELSSVLIYNFHVTNRCPSCIAIEEATTKTLNTYFAAEMKQGRIKRQILNVDDEANKFISQKYEAFGSGLFVTRIYKGKETTTDFTGDGFKYARNKEEKFIEILKNKISEYLK